MLPLPLSMVLVVPMVLSWLLRNVVTKKVGTKVSYSGSVSLAHRARKMDTMNAQEWCDALCGYGTGRDIYKTYVKPKG